MNKSILTLYAGSSEEWKVPFQTSRAIRRGMQELFSQFLEFGITPYRAPMKAFDGTQFTKAWTWDGKKWLLKEHVKPRVIWNKLRYGINVRNYADVGKMHRQYTMLNTPYLIALASDKYITNRLFSQWMVKTWYAVRRQELLAVKSQVETSRVVVKPSIGSSGKWVKILPTKKLDTVAVTAPLVIQEFIDGTQGIPGLVKGSHDLRVGVFGDEVAYSYIRTPKEGSLIANIARGGRAMYVPVDRIPKSAMEIVNDIIATLRGPQPSIYTVDIMYDKGKTPRLLEINNSPGVSFTGLKDVERRELQHQFVRYFASVM